MGVKKGTNNFKSYQKTRVESSARLIRSVLEELYRHRLKFEKLSDLVSYVSKKTKVHRTTLNRNPDYKRMLLDYYEGQNGAANLEVNEQSSPQIFMAKIRDLTIQLRNEKNTISRLTSFIEKEGIKEKHQIESTETHGIGNEEQLSDMGMLLMLLIERFPDSISIDVENRKFLDLAARGEKKVIAEAPRTTVFFNWLQDHKKLFL